MAENNIIGHSDDGPITTFMAQANQPFFRPNDNWWAVVGGLPWRWKQFTDVGAGCGHLTRLMRERGFKVQAYDKYARSKPEVDDIQIRDVVTGMMSVSLLDCLILARPCHDGFAGHVIRDNFECFIDVLYVGRPENVEGDIGEFEIERLAVDVGAEGEELWRIKAATSGKSRERYFAPSYYSPAEMCDDASRAGWIAPDGTWYGCAESDHNKIAEQVLGTSVGWIEDAGFVRCHGDYADGNLWAFGSGRWGFPKREHRITMAQGRTLKRKGYKLKPDHITTDIVEPEGFMR